jgi:lipopolysaccharide biosynthesis protein
MVGPGIRARALLSGAVFEAVYLAAQCRLGRSPAPTAKVAVCIHLYHTDKWDLLVRRLANLGDEPFDLFVTLARPKRRFAATIRADFADAHIMVVPNRGRGTLPFIKTAQVLLKEQYEVVLKLHCKKSGAEQDGGAYLEVVLDRLLPGSPGLVREIVGRLLSQEAALIGPSEVYVPLDMAFLANKEHLAALMGRLCDPDVARQVLDHPDGYGFFAGSMFWARLDELAPLLNFRAYDFEPERGQINGTLAHVLERLFSLLPRLGGRQVLEVVDGVLRPRESASDNVLWWWKPSKPPLDGRIP